MEEPASASTPSVFSGSGKRKRRLWATNPRALAYTGRCRVEGAPARQGCFRPNAAQGRLVKTPAHASGRPMAHTHRKGGPLPCWALPARKSRGGAGTRQGRSCCRPHGGADTGNCSSLLAVTFLLPGNTHAVTPVCSNTVVTTTLMVAALRVLAQEHPWIYPGWFTSPSLVFSEAGTALPQRHCPGLGRAEQGAI